MAGKSLIDWCGRGDLKNKRPVWEAKEDVASSETLSEISAVILLAAVCVGPCSSEMPTIGVLIGQ
jgi:hypothetical protein